MKKPNRLVNETSPYLLQHAYNPVDWYPWSEEALETAKERNKPLFISIGYSTCHWCHVMERESFEDEEIAAYLNENYVCIKVDREENPDIDHYYMEACQVMTGRGGWPLSIFAAHSRKPFLAGTYFPKTSSSGRMGFKEILLRVSEVWNNNPESILYNVNEIQQDLSKQLAFNNSAGFDSALFQKAFNQYKNTFDPEDGGFGNSPKFPSPQNLLFLLRYYYHFKDESALSIVETSVKHICAGGVFDHIGSGFHRYSTDKKWLVPHFEKMLYDQAMMILILTDLYRLTHSNFYKYFLENTIKYISRKLLSPEGGFYSAQDADSEGVEGKYYVWIYEELSKELSVDEMQFIEKYFNIKEEGNYQDEHSYAAAGSNIFHFDLAYADEFEEVMAQFQPVRKKLFSVRKERVPPILDNKILTDWNGLMIYALSSAGFALKSSKIINMAKGAYGFLFQNNYDGEKLNHSITSGNKSTSTILDDYAFAGLAGLALFEVSGEASYLSNSIRMAKTLNDSFYDAAKHLFRLSVNFFPEENYSIFDNAYPSGNSAAFLFFSRLHHYTKDEKYQNVLLSYSENIPEIIHRHPSSASFLLQAMFDIHSDFKEVIIAYDNDDELSEVLEPLRSKYIPNMTLTLINNENIEVMSGINNFFKSFKPHLHGVNVFICDKDGCSLPRKRLDID